jgi:hypothetical protein
MPAPLALCLEDLSDPADEDRFLQCTALVGGGPGLGFDAAGRVCWDTEAPCLLAVSLDDRLILLLREGGPRTVVTRDGRTLVVPAGKPVVLLDGDEVTVGVRPFRVHVHGRAPAVAPPARLGRGLLAAAALAGATIFGCDKAPSDKPIEVKASPPAVAPRPPDAAPPDAGKPDAARPDAAPPDASPSKRQPIEVRPQPPVVAPIHPPQPPKKP